MKQDANYAQQIQKQFRDVDSMPCQQNQVPSKVSMYMYRYANCIEVIVILVFLLSGRTLSYGTIDTAV